MPKGIMEWSPSTVVSDADGNACLSSKEIDYGSESSSARHMHEGLSVAVAARE
eukprot:CAMPEP_0204651362 /NCGR_PEP_ID=MMETSP0718-20130828/13119_1 /ASSEMBLY_ACC=CAM_ASM_000674 /TAXON_ID=230516 /ORGANISM="Chaetoceros curvisetus" /LENGTH=52 /DNA_ID=CAMNT_0051675073 /DNA_START=248 /DNA_END=406 /DNA_ORIENTATION=-